ncbi:MAG: hypoxanthine phosphoribosyltransferase [Oscillospiraceae bacterium]|nr:hypoxanthine phosphoribosyltransferase [Oscillospiraceae bacterium]
MNKDVERILFTEAEIKQRVKELGAQITNDYEGKELVVIGILKGAFVFMSDLVRAIDLDCRIDFMSVSSYGDGTMTTGQVNIMRDIGCDIAGKHVIIVEDILDTGVTLSYLKSYLANRWPASIKICTMLDKPSRRRADITPDYCGYTVPDAFIVGYGLDYAERYRNIPEICVLKEEVYS